MVKKKAETPHVFIFFFSFNHVGCLLLPTAFFQAMTSRSDMTDTNKSGTLILGSAGESNSGSCLQ